MRIYIREVSKTTTATEVVTTFMVTAKSQLLAYVT